MTPMTDHNGISSDKSKTRSASSINDSRGNLEKAPYESNDYDYDYEDECEVDGYVDEDEQENDDSNAKATKDKSLTSTWVQMELEALEQEQLKIDREAAQLERKLRNVMESGKVSIAHYM